jgi:hypothetical protein
MEEELSLDSKTELALGRDVFPFFQRTVPRKCSVTEADSIRAHMLRRIDVRLPIVALASELIEKFGLEELPQKDFRRGATVLTLRRKSFIRPNETLAK